MKKIAPLVETTQDRAAGLSRASGRCLVSSSSREPSAQLKSSASNTRNKACHKAPAKVITMNVTGGNSKEIFELFTNKLVFSVSVSQRWRIRWWSWLAISSLDSPLERSASSRIIMKEFLFSIWFISLSSNLKLSIDIFIMSVSHVFADFRFIFVKRSCSRRDGTSLFSLFYIFYKKFCWYCECTQIKVDPLQFRMMYYSYLYEQKLLRKFFPLEKNAIDCTGASMSCALTSTLHTK